MAAREASETQDTRHETRDARDETREMRRERREEDAEKKVRACGVYVPVCVCARVCESVSKAKEESGTVLSEYQQTARP